MVRTGRISIMVVCMVVLWASVVVTAPDVSLWESLDIVPMPKEIELTGRELPLTGAVLVLGASPSKQDEIGAQWISDRITALEGAAPEVVSASQATAAPLRIIIGTRESNPLIEAAAVAGDIKVGSGEPGERGYVISSRPGAEETEILLAGADDVGALYACVTLAELMFARDREVLLREAQVTDWPDFMNVTLGASYTGSSYDIPELRDLYRTLRNTAEPGEEFHKKFLAAMYEHYDRLLHWKVTSLWCGTRNEFFKIKSPAALALFKEAIAYGKERGIGALFYSMCPFAGLVKDHPEYHGASLQNPRWDEWIRCWSLDDMRRQTAEDFAKFCGEVGFTDIGFHDTDTGWYLNPAQWNERCDKCRKRWGDDYAAATANKFRIYYDALSKYAPDATMHIVIYPYGLQIYTQEGAERLLTERFGPGPGLSESARRLRERWETFYRRITKMLPQDINFCIRENPPENLEAYRSLIGDRGLFVYFKLLTDPWSSFFSECPRWTGTFYNDRRDFLYSPTLETFVPAQALAVREYAWNGNAPGAAPYARLPVEEQWKHCEPQGEIYSIILPHVVRNLFGRRTGDEIAGALAKNVSPFEIFGYKMYGGSPVFVKTYDQMRSQAHLAAEGADLLDAAWAKRQSEEDKLGMTDYAFRRFVYLRETFHCCKQMAIARAHGLHARELAREGRLEEAKAAIEAGKQAVQDAKLDAERLLAERPDDKIYEAADAPLGAKRFRVFTPGVYMDYDVALSEIQQTEQELPTLVTAAGIPEDILANLDASRVVHAGHLSTGITLDGHLDEPAWATVYASESFFVYKEGRKIASAHTSVRLLYDDDSIYVGCTCWLPDGGTPVAQQREHDGPVLEDDCIEVFLAPPELDGGYLHLAINAAGSLRDQRVTAAPSGTGIISMQRDPEWNAQNIEVHTSQRDGRWDAELRIPLSDLGAVEVGSGWRANLTRQYRSANDTREPSCILPSTCRDFHDVAKFRSVIFSPEDFRATPPEAEIEIAGFEAKTETLNDRTATVCRFSVDIRCSRVLHGATLTAETYGPEAELHQRVQLAERPAVFYAWAPDDTLEVGFLNPVDSGGIRLLLQCEETTVERWIRFGGWEGSEAAGAVLHASAGRGGSGALAGSCTFTSRIVPPGKEEEAPLIGSRSGTIEFWLRPASTGLRPTLAGNFEMWEPRHCLFHFGPLRAEHPYTVNHSSVLIEHYGTSMVRFGIYAPVFAGWSVTADLDKLEGWDPNRWHHIAAVWDADAQRAEWLRVYVDGKRASGAIEVAKEERLGEDPSVRAPGHSPYPVQLGSLTSGRAPARALLDELRISRVARYQGHFEPPADPFKLDDDTSALFHFDGNLIATGRTPDGDQYSVDGVAGVVQHY